MIDGSEVGLGICMYVTFPYFGGREIIIPSPLSFSPPFFGKGGGEGGGTGQCVQYGKSERRQLERSTSQQTSVATTTAVRAGAGKRGAECE